jgi:hypothetical protein
LEANKLDPDWACIVLDKHTKKTPRNSSFTIFILFVFIKILW